MDIMNALRIRGGLFWGVASIAGVFLLGIVDYLTGYDVSISLFYLAPIAAASWFVGRRMGFAVSCLSAVVWFLADIASGHVYLTRWIYVWNLAARLGFFVVVTLLLDNLRESYRRERDLARTDRTTGTANSRYFYEFAQLELERARRFGRPLSLAYLDIDDFKLVNDRFGHAQGDEVLRAVSNSVREHLRATDLIARLGGDEFGVLLTETDQAGAQAAVAKIQDAMFKQMRGQPWLVTISIGVVTFVTPPSSVDAMVRAADDLMYTVKADSKNGVRFELRAGV